MCFGPFRPPVYLPFYVAPYLSSCIIGRAEPHITAFERFKQQLFCRQRVASPVRQPHRFCTHSLVRQPGRQRTKREVPKAEYRRKILVTVSSVNEMMCSVESRRHDDGRQRPLDIIRQINIAMVHLRAETNYRLEQKPSECRRAPKDNPNRFHR